MRKTKSPAKKRGPKKNETPAKVIRGETDVGGHGACAEMRAPDGNVFGLWRA
jgi:predicted enzyme related to lactoylglutathione lyase